MKCFITNYTKENIEFMERYTLSTFTPSRENIQRYPPISYIKEKEKWVFRTIYGDDIYLTEDESTRLMGCFKCDKIKENNWSSYCKSNCPYYFNTDTLKTIFGIKINKIKEKEEVEHDSNC